MGCDEPRPSWMIDARERSDRRWARIEALREKLKGVPLFDFTADYALALCIIVDPQVIEGRHVDNDGKKDEALDKLEAFFAEREKASRKKPLKAKTPKKNRRRT